MPESPPPGALIGWKVDWFSRGSYMPNRHIFHAETTPTAEAALAETRRKYPEAVKIRVYPRFAETPPCLEWRRDQ